MPNESGNKPVPHTKKHIARLERERRQGRVVLYTFVGLLVAIVALLGYGFLDIKFLQLRKPVAKVGDVEILAGPFEARVKLQRQQLLGQYGQYSQYQQVFGMDFSSQLQQISDQLDNPVSVGQSVLDQMIDEELIRQEAAKRGIVVTEDEVTRFIQGNYDYFPNGTPTPTITPTDVVMPDVPAEAYQVVTVTPEVTATLSATSTLEPTATLELLPTATGTLLPTATATTAPTATLEPTATVTLTPGPTATPQPTSTPVSLEGFQKNYQDVVNSLGRFGVTDEQYRAFFEVQLLREKLKEVITADVPTTEEQVWARHILVDDQETALVIIDKIKAGDDFASLAKEFSKDTGSAANGGDLGWFGKGMMVAEFETAAFALEKPGDISAPVQSQFGYHIIQLIAKQDRPLAPDKVSQAKDTAFSDWLKSARDTYGVETFDFWKERVPTEPNFVSAATESAKTAFAASTATAKVEDTYTETPAPTATP